MLDNKADIKKCGNLLREWQLKLMYRQYKLPFLYLLLKNFQTFYYYFLLKFSMTMFQYCFFMQKNYSINQKKKRCLFYTLIIINKQILLLQLKLQKFLIVCLLLYNIYKFRLYHNKYLKTE